MPLNIQLDKENDMPEKGLHEPKLTDKIPSVLLLKTGNDNPDLELGITEVMDIVDLAKEVKEAYDVVMADGEVTFGDFLASPKETLYDVGKALFKLWEGKDLILPQLSDIDYTEAEEIVNAVVEKLGVTGEQAKEIINNSIKGVYYIYAAIRAF